MNATQRTRAVMIATLVGIAVAVLAFGRRPAPRLPSDSVHASGDLVSLRETLSLNIPGQATPSHQPIPDAGEPIDWAAIERQQAREPDVLTITSIRVSNALEPGNAAANSAAPTTSVAPPPAPAQRERPVRYHRIVEGDTLRELASRYLGSADRYLELFYANRAVLPHPDVLPLHARLVIPERSDPLNSVVNSSDAAEARAALPWTSRRQSAAESQLPRIESPEGASLRYHHP